MADELTESMKELYKGVQELANRIALAKDVTDAADKYPLPEGIAYVQENLPLGMAKTSAKPMYKTKEEAIAASNNEDLQTLELLTSSIETYIVEPVTKIKGI